MSTTFTASMDGNTAAAHISYFFTEVAGIFPITPSSPMAELVDEWSATGRKNMFGQTVRLAEMQSEGGAAGTVHGALGAGALTTTYTASQGLLLMIPNMYKIAGELLPGVFHVSARTVSVHALSIFGDHSDVMACRQTGFALLASGSPQEAMDMGAVAHLAAIRGRLPFLHFFDGFRTSHEIQKIDAFDYKALRPLVDWDAVAAFRARALNPEHPVTRGTTQNPDIFFQQREAANPFFTALPGIVQSYMDDINRLTGRDYHLFDYYGAPQPESVVIAMGSVCGAVREAVDHRNAAGGNVGMVTVRLYRPFSAEHLLKAIPASVRRIAVLDRTKEPGAVGEPLYTDIRNVYYSVDPSMRIVGGRYGLSSKDTTPGQILAVFENLEKDQPRDGFTIGIVDDVTNLSLPTLPEPPAAADTFACKVWGTGSDGTVGANKNSVKIVGDATDYHTQAYFVYDSKKSGGLTQSHLRFSPRPITASYLVANADFVACHSPAHVDKYDLAADLKPGGIFLLNCPWSAAELDARLPAGLRRGLAAKGARLYAIDAGGIAKGLGLGGRTNTVLQAAFFKLTGLIPLEDAVARMKKANHDTYYKKFGAAVVDMNNAAVDAGIVNLVEVPVPSSWADAADAAKAEPDLPHYVAAIAAPMNRQQGDSLPVSAFVGMEDGSFPPGSSAYEKRGAAAEVPQWLAEKCIQCNRCALVCPHAAIRPALLDAAEAANKPSGFVTLQAVGKGLEPYAYRMQVSPLDCTGCGSCVSVCPAREKALAMRPLQAMRGEDDNWRYAATVADKPVASDKTVKSSQFARPLFEFSGACAGCGETPYIKLLTQLFGPRMYIANASGCSTAFGGSTPSTPYTVGPDGRGPAWAMSLFEDNAEYAFGMLLAAEQVRAGLEDAVRLVAEKGLAAEAADAYLSDVKNPAAASALVAALETATSVDPGLQRAVAAILGNREYLARKSVWAMGGDGWAYDIGYGGLDHVLASGLDINVLVLDTEVYSNTGGQSSKATAPGAVAKFASAGKETGKKDLGRMAMSYGYVYVAQVALGADPEQTLRALREAEAYPGPAIVIAYCPCVEHGIRAGMQNSQAEAKKAVESGYWHLYRYDPTRREAGQNPFQLDSKPPSSSLEDFLAGEGRYASLALRFPERAETLRRMASENARLRLEAYRELRNGGS